MATSLLTEAEVEEHRERTKPTKVRMRIDDSSDDNEEADDKPTDYDNEFINDGDPDEDADPNDSWKLEEMEKQLADKKSQKKEDVHPPKRLEMRRGYMSKI